MAYFDNIKLEKGMYSSGKSFTQTLEELDPSENYKNTELEGLDAYQRQLKRFDIHVGGTHSDCVQKFFENTNSATLFPEYITRAVKQGAEKADVLKEIIAAKTIIDGMDYRSVISAPVVDANAVSPVAEAGLLPQTNIRTRENLVQLKKHGRMLVASYEAIKFQKLDLFTVTLRQIGAYIARKQLNDAVTVLLNGDGDSGSAEVIAASGNHFTYNDLLSLWGAVSPYQLNTILAPTASMTQLLGLSEMRDANAGLDFQSTGKMITPLGAKLVHIPEMESGQIIGFDKDCALEMVQAGDIITDYDKLIDRQLERAAISCISGFVKIFPDSVKVLQTGASS